MKKTNKTKKLGKYLRRVEPEELKTVSGGVNADNKDRTQLPSAGGSLPGSSLPSFP